PPGFQKDWYYAAGLGWQMSKESFIKDNVSWINLWKWRATYGRTGNNNVDDYQYFGYRQTYSTTIRGYGVGVNKNLVFSFNEDALANASIHAEKGNKFDFGTDISLFKDHFQITADYYYDKYSELLGIRGKSILLIGANAPNVTEGNLTFAGNGSIYPVENIGTSAFKGGELTLTFKSNVRNFNYFISANGAIQSTKVIFSDEQVRPNAFNYRTGQPINAIFGYKSLGLFQSAEEAASSPTILGYNAQAGDIKYADIGGIDGKPDGVIDRFDEMPIGNTKPLMFYGASFGFNYKGFSVSVLLQGVHNRNIYQSPSLLNGFGGLTGSGIGAPYGQAYESAVGRWTEETAATATSPRVSISNLNNNQQSSFYIRSGNYFRIKNAEIGYTLPYSWTKRINVSGIRVFVNGENLYTITGYKGFDPEVFPNNTPGSFPYPIQRVFNAGVSIKL
ncbi:MAG: SusC/RagA family TonB-linked outer membrane protein, partial [Mucilaginibacter sp.]